MSTPSTHRPDASVLSAGATWRRALVYGLGVSGAAASELLRAYAIEVVAVDRRAAVDIDLGALASDHGVRLLLGGELDTLPDDLAWSDLDVLVTSPGVPADRPLLRAARAHGVPVIAEVELAAAWLERHGAASIVAITGSNGKSTTTALVGAMLEADGQTTEVCGNIGQPMSRSVLDHIADDAGASAPTYVVELSSFQLETIDRFRARAAALLNLAADHLDRHSTFEAYRDAKLRIFERQQAHDVAVVNADDPQVLDATAGVTARRRLFSRLRAVDDGCHLEGTDVIETDAWDASTRVLFSVDDLPLAGPHNLENAMAAALLCRARGAEPAALRRGLRQFRGLPHRLQRVAEQRGIAWFDDSKGTNPAATLRSLQGFEDGRVLIILGGQFKGGDLEPLARLVARKARVAYLIGDAADVFYDALSRLPGSTAKVERSGTLERAVEQAAAAAVPGDTVLLSPACASFDQFRSYVDRGRRFQQLVDAVVVGPGSTGGAVTGDAEEARDGA